MLFILLGILVITFYKKIGKKLYAHHYIKVTQKLLGVEISIISGGLILILLGVFMIVSSNTSKKYTLPSDPGSICRVDGDTQYCEWK